jgi:hypothetical protein
MSLEFTMERPGVAQDSALRWVAGGIVRADQIGIPAALKSTYCFPSLILKNIYPEHLD